MITANKYSNYSENEQRMRGKLFFWTIKMVKFLTICHYCVFTCSKISHSAITQITQGFLTMAYSASSSHTMNWQKFSEISIHISMPYWSLTHCQIKYQASIHPACSAPERMSGQWLDLNTGSTAVEISPILLLPACRGPEQQEHLPQSNDQCCQPD